MKAKELVQKIQNSLCDDAEVDFLLVDGGFTWLDLVDINMNADIDDLNNINSGGLVFIKKGF